MTTQRKPAKKPSKSKRPAPRVKQPKPGDWLVYTPDRTTLLDFGRDLARVRTRLAQKGVALRDCFLSRVPFEIDEPVELAGIETDVG